MSTFKHNSPRRKEQKLATTYSPEEIAAFWDANPCLQDFIASADDWRDFFERHDSYKHTHEPHTAKELGSIAWEGKRVLEIGPGEGCEAAQIIRLGGQYNGIDLSSESVRRVTLRCKLFSLPYESIRVMNAEHMDFPDDSFDIVFTHGVIHHSPRIQDIIHEIHRVLRPNGMLVLMVYHRHSINYYLSIGLLRRLGVFLLFLPGMPRLISKLTHEDQHRLQKHLRNLKREGLGYLRMKRFIHKSTDGPDNVFSSVFSEDEVRNLCCAFRELRFRRHFLNERHLPILRSILPAGVKERLAAVAGWHLWLTAVK